MSDEAILNTPLRYRHDRLPRVDYAAHPAYGAVWTASDRLAALGRFARGLSVAWLRWAVDFEHLPKPPAGVGRAGWLLRSAPRLAAGAVRHNLRRAARGGTAPASGADEVVREALADDGVFVFRMTAAEQARMAELTDPWFRELEGRLAAGIRDFDDNRVWIDEARAPEPYAWFREMLARAGVVGGSRAYLGRPVTVAHLIPQINTLGTDFWTGQFADIGEPDPACNYCHVDTAWGITKMIVYLGEVDEANGPFAYVRGSHRARDGFWGRLVRKANDHAGLSSTRPAVRRLFAALPRALQHKAAFGPDLRDSHPMADDLLRAEWRITSDHGHGILFDPDGVHRGGMVREGRRRVVGVLLAEV